MLTDDEISELAEVLWDACREAEEGGHKIGIKCNEWCPFHALVGPNWFNVESINPSRRDIKDRTNLEEREVAGFVDGFDFGYDRTGGNKKMLNLGILFRNQAMSCKGFN